MQQIYPELLHGSAGEHCGKTEHHHKCNQAIVESSVVQKTGGNEIHDFNNSLYRFLQVATSLFIQSLLVDNAGLAFRFADGTL